MARLVRARTGEAEDVYFDFVYAPLRAASGEVDGILVCGFEVTAQVNVRAAAGAACSRLPRRTSASSVSSSKICRSSPGLRARDGHIDYYNQRWYEYTGMTSDGDARLGLESRA